MAGHTLPAEKTILHHAEEGDLEKREASTDIPQQMILTPEHKASNRRLNRRLDIFLLPLLSLLYLFNGLDRSNIGNAETQGFTSDIGAAKDDLNLSTSLFFITFVLLQPPSAAVGRWLGAKYWIPIIMTAWGVLTIGQAFIKGRGALIAIRLLIGAFEAGFYPTAVAYLSFFYTRYDLAVRLGLFYGQYAIAGAFSGAIAYGVFQIQNKVLHSWQYLFIIEGALTVLMAGIALFWLPEGPGKAWFLSKTDRTMAAERMRKDNELYVQHTYGESGVERERLTKRDVTETAKDWKLWYILFFNICGSVPSQAFSVFLPLVVQGLGYKSIEANLMSVPPYVCGAVGLYLFALSSDKMNERGWHIVGGLFIALIGLIITVTAPTHGGQYTGLCILLFGSYVSAPLTVAWLSGNTPEPGMRALVLGVNGFGNFAGVIGSQLYRPAYAPSYRVPFFATLGFIAMAFLGYISYRYTLAMVNVRKRNKIASITIRDIEIERTNDLRYSDKKWTFQYGL